MQIGFDDQFRLLRFFIGRRDAGKFGNFTAHGTGVKPLGVAPLTDFNVTFDKDFDKAPFRQQGTGKVAISGKGRDKGADGQIAMLKA